MIHDLLEIFVVKRCGKSSQQRIGAKEKHTFRCQMWGVLQLIMSFGNVVDAVRIRESGSSSPERISDILKPLLTS